MITCRPQGRDEYLAPRTGSASVIGHTYGSATTSAPCSSWAAEVVDPRELQQHYDIVVMVVEKILSRASPKHHTRETGSASKGRKMPTKGHMRDGGMSVLCEDLHPSIYRRRGRQPPRGSTPQEVPPPLPSSCGWTLHSQKKRVTHYSHNSHNSPLKIPRVYHIKTLLILLFNVTQINEHFIQ